MVAPNFCQNPTRQNAGFFFLGRLLVSGEKNAFFQKNTRWGDATLQNLGATFHYLNLGEALKKHCKTSGFRHSAPEISGVNLHPPNLGVWAYKVFAGVRSCCRFRGFGGSLALSFCEEMLLPGYLRSPPTDAGSNNVAPEKACEEVVVAAAAIGVWFKFKIYLPVFNLVTRPKLRSDPGTVGSVLDLNGPNILNGQNDHFVKMTLFRTAF